MNLILGLLSALLFVFSFPPFDISIFGWIIITPAILLAKRLSTPETRFRSLVLYSFIPAFVYSVGGFYWVAYVAHAFGGIPWVFAIVILLGYSIIAGLHVSFFIMILSLFFRSARARKAFISRMAISPPLIAALYTGIDYVYPKIFPETMGHSQHNNTGLIQILDLFGQWGLTFLLVFVGATVFLLIDAYIEKRKPFTGYTLSMLAVSLALVVSSVVYSSLRINQISTLVEKEGKALTAGLIQANIGDADKFLAESGDSATIDTIIRRFRTMSARLLDKKPDLIVWPETAFPRLPSEPFMPEDRMETERKPDLSLSTVAADQNVYLFTGAYDYSFRYDLKKGKRKILHYNSSYLISPEGKWVDNYRKHILLIFGEYMPFSDYFPFLLDAFPAVSSFGKGKGSKTMTLSLDRGEFKFTPLICYEVLIPSFVRESARQGSDFLLNITNDSWFGPYSEPYQHLALSKFRSIELKQPMIRATNTGISAFIDILGRVQSKSSIFKEEVLLDKIMIINNNKIITLYHRIGDILPRLCFLLVLLILGHTIYILINNKDNNRIDS